MCLPEKNPRCGNAIVIPERRGLEKLIEMIGRFSAVIVCALFLAVAQVAAAQPGTATPAAQEAAPQDDVPAANPARPTISTPAALTPAGYLQFESGFQQAWHSGEFSSQASVNEVVKLAVSRWIEFIVLSGPYAHSRVGGQPGNGTGDVDLGCQAVVYQGGGVRPTVALSYFHSIHSGDAPDVDIGSARSSGILLFSADVKGFHIDTDYLFNEVVDQSDHRSQYGQTLSISHPLAGKFGLAGEMWHFTQPFLRSNAVGSLWALNYNAKKNLVLDAGFDRGLTSTSTRWEAFAGFTYVLPHRVFPH